jgi:HAD superfamily hydrolase (TIGR01509 family)
MNAIDTILFDWDGTLIDSAQSAFNAFQKAFCDLGIPVVFDVYERIYSPNWYIMYQTLQLPEEKWQEADDLWLMHYGKETPDLVPGVRPAVMELRRRGYVLGIVTSGSQSRVGRELDAIGMSENFRTVVCNEDVVNKKPHPEGLHRAMNHMGKRPEACCYVGDSPHDMEMGKRANIRTIGILSRYPSSKKLSSAHPDFCFDSVTQLLGHFPDRSNGLFF